MSDVFLSYARTDRACAAAIAEALNREGFSVWWDAEIVTGQRYDRIIEEALAHAHCVIVLWSRHSVDSDWVRAEGGDLEAQIELGYALQEGDGVPVDHEEGLHWLLRAAGRGDSAAQNRLGTTYLNGLGVDACTETAVEWFGKAAEQDNTDALYNLATMYLHGRGVSPDDHVARDLLERASRGGCEAADDVLLKLQHLHGDEDDW